MSSRERIEEFKERYREALENLGLRVEYFGSTEESWRWRRGRSDLDIVVRGRNIPARIKARGVLLIRDLNLELDLGLEEVPIWHPTPIYLDSPIRDRIWRFLESLRSLTDSLRIVIKDLDSWPLTYGTWWELVERIERSKLYHLLKLL